MSPQALIDRLEKAGVRLWKEGDRLHFSAPKGVITPALRDEMATRKPELLPLLRPPEPKLERRPGAEIPLSPVQERLWFLHQLDPEDPAYNIPVALRVRGRLNIPALETALNALIQRHELLRTACESDGGQAKQRTAPAAPVSVTVRDLSGLPDEHRERECAEAATAEFGRPFNLAEAPLLRCLVLQLAEAEYVLLLTTHHYVSDGWTLRLLLEELSEHYAGTLEGTAPAAADPVLQYGDFARWQRECLEGGLFQDQLDYWKRQLDGAPAALNLPFDHPRPATLSAQGGICRFVLPASLSNGIRQLARQRRVTLYTALLTVYEVLLWRYSGQDDFVVGTAVSSRNRRELEELIGNLSNNLPLRAGFTGNPTFGELLTRTWNTVIAAHRNQDLPFDKLVDELKLQRDTSTTPLFQCTFLLHDRPPLGGLQLPGAKLEPFPLAKDAARFDLMLTVIDGAEELNGHLEYKTDLFDHATVERMAGHFENLLRAVVSDPDGLAAALPLLSEPEVKLITGTWNDTGRAYPLEERLDALIEKQVRRTPDAIAVVAGNARLTYRELDGRANQLARRLRQSGVGADAAVGLFLERTEWMVIAMLAVLKAGGGYVPLDPTDPEHRISYIVEDSGMRVVVSQPELTDSLPETSAAVVLVDADETESAEALDAVEGSSSNLAYVIYTSGSTGRSKGVMVAHRQVVNYALGIIDVCRFQPGWNHIVVQPFTVDSSVTMLFPPLLSGGTIHVVSRAIALDAPTLAGYMEQHRIDTLKIAPSHLAALGTAVGAGRLMPRECLIVGGESSPRSWIQSLRKAAPQCAIFNHYGPTETTVGVTAIRVGADGTDGITGQVPIGRPLPNVQAYILDRSRQPVPIGVTGELYFGGECVSRGYLNRPELTEQVFVPDHLSRKPGARLYRTGDLARYAPGGAIEFLGRVDAQVKIRGFRVEPGEVEAALTTHPDVLEAAVVARTDAATHETALIAYAVPVPGQSLSEAELQTFARQRLPEHMIPRSLMIMDALPRTAHGKRDLRSLPDPEPGTGAPAANFVAPRTTVESMLARIWSNLLGVPRVGIHDDFFALGGHSLLAVTLATRISEVFEQEVPVATIFRAPTVERYATLLEDKGWTPPWTTLVALQPRGAQPPFFCIHSNTGHVFLFQDLARRLAPDRPVYGLQARGVEYPDSPHESVEQMATHYLREIRSLQPEGPYYLGGFCLGSYVALEMARQLEAEGQEIGLLVAFNTDGGWRMVHSSKDALRMHLRRLKRLGWRQGLMYILERSLFRLGRIRNITLDRLSRKWPGRPPAAFRRLQLEELNRRISARYAPHPVESKLVLFQGVEDAYKDPTIFWKTVARGGVDVHVVPGGYFSVLREPDVGALAERLQALLGDR